MTDDSVATADALQAQIEEAQAAGNHERAQALYQQQQGTADADSPGPAPPKRKGGRPKGLGKVPGSGRRKGTPNRTRVQVLERINKEADPIGYLIRVTRGLQLEAAANVGDTKKVKMYPTADQQIDAAKTLARKVLPDVKSTELTGKDGGDLAMTLVDFLKGLPV